MAKVFISFPHSGVASPNIRPVDYVVPTINPPVITNPNFQLPRPVHTETLDHRESLPDPQTVLPDPLRTAPKTCLQSHNHLSHRGTPRHIGSPRAETLLKNTDGMN